MIEDLSLKGLKLIYPKKFEDERGFFFESYQRSSYCKMGIEEVFVQDNFSFSKKDTVRGLHFQARPGQAKLVTCLSGEIWDVVVDLRKDSETFGKWESVTLDGQDLKQLYIPIGFAHGFCVLSREAFVLYKVTSSYDPLEEKTLRWNDPFVDIAWPTQDPILSKRDRISPFFEEVALL